MQTVLAQQWVQCKGMCQYIKSPISIKQTLAHTMEDRWRASITKLMRISRTFHWCQEHEATSVEGDDSAKGEIFSLMVVLTPNK